MKYLRPIAVTPAMLVSSNIMETDAPAWAAATTYAAGARVISTATHRVYESAIAGNVGQDPAAGGAAWIDLGPTNRWAMFDAAPTTRSSRATPLRVTLAPDQPVTAVAVLEPIATSVRVIVTADGVTTYDRTEAGSLNGVPRSAITFLDLPWVAGAQVEVRLNADAGDASAGSVLIGSVTDLGTTETDPTLSLSDFSRRETDDFGVTTVVERAWSKRITARSLVDSALVDAVQRRLAAIRAVPVLWIGDEAFESLTLFGFYKDFSLDLQLGTKCYCSLTIEGLPTGDLPIAAIDPAVSGTSDLRVLRPIAITEAMLTASSVAEADYPEWSDAVVYPLGARVMRAAAHRLYESLIPANIDNQPGVGTEWLDIGPTNRWAALDQALGTVTTANGLIAMTITPDQPVTAVAALDLAARSMRVQAPGYDRTVQIGESGGASFLDLAAPAGTPIKVTVSPGAGPVDIEHSFTGAALPSAVTLTRATAATRINASGARVSEAVDAPRFDYAATAPFALRGLLIEPEATNRALFSRDLTGAAWTAVGLVPNATALIEAAGTDVRQVSQSVAFTNGQATTLSAVASERAGSAKRYLVIFVPTAVAGTVARATFDLAAGTFTTSGPCTATMTQTAGGWLCAITVTPTATVTVLPMLRLASASNSSGIAYLGDGTSGLNVSEVQVEAGTRATARIRTSATAATRAADVVKVTWAADILDGIYTARYTFDDGSTQDAALVIADGVSTIPTTLNRARLRSIKGIALMPGRGVQVAVGTLMLGAVEPLGVIETSPTVGITDYSRKEADAFGVTVPVERAWAKKMAVRSLVASAAVDGLFRRLASLRATPALWIGQEGVDSLTVYGFFRDATIALGGSVSTLGLSIEGLSTAAPLPTYPLGVVPWPEIPDPDGTKPADNADVTGDNTSKDTVAVGGRGASDVLQTIDINVVAILEQALRQDDLVQVFDARTLVEGQPVSVTFLAFRDAQVTENSALATTLSLIGAKTPDGTAWNLNLDTVRVGTVSLAGRLGSFDNALADLGLDLGGVSQQVGALSTSLDELGAAYGDTQASVTSLEEAFATDGGGYARFALTGSVNTDGSVSVVGISGIATQATSELNFVAEHFNFVDPNDGAPIKPFSISDGKVYATDFVADTITYGALVPLFAEGGKQDLDPDGWYQELPGGVIMQGGRYRASINRDTPIPIVFPRPFPNQVLATGASGFITSDSPFADLIVQNLGEPTLTGTTFYAQATNGDATAIQGIDWWAWGR